jgi:hypothetical protein
MPKRLSKKPSSDPNKSAFRVVQRIAALTEGEQPKRRDNVVAMPSRRKNAAAVALGRKGGKASAAARMDKIDPDDRRRIASNAARARWAKAKG